VIVYDIFSPPVASRVYAYPCIAAYQSLSPTNPELRDLSGLLKDLGPTPQPVDSSFVSYNLSAIYAFFKVSKALIFSEEKLQIQINTFNLQLDEIGISENVKNASLKYGEQVADHILEWASKDNYKQTRTYPKFSITDDASKWKPTPPSYMEAIEPNWREIRTLVLDSASQFKPAPPTSFSTDKGSQFYIETMEVYETVNKLDEEQKKIASFWDCNPYVMNQTGHIMFATKKITPGGHWMGIANIATRDKKLSLAKSIETTTLVSIGLFDAFISCWDEKYRSGLIRPESVINAHIDESWKPLLQTPPFPEHTSGHSVISTTAAHLLTAIIGDNFAYTDDVEQKYGLPIRDYDSFLQASSEAAISRLYGGIHYMPAISDGVEQGENVGKYIIDKLIGE